MMQDRQLCPLCRKCGVKSYLQSFQINLDEAVHLCENNKCSYPLGVQDSDTTCIFNRNYTDIKADKLQDVHRIPSTQLSLQARVASHMVEYGQKIQGIGTGTQTGSPLLTKPLIPKKSITPKDFSKWKQNGSGAVYRKLSQTVIGVKTPGAILQTGSVPTNRPLQFDSRTCSHNFESKTTDSKCSSNSSSPVYPGFQYAQGKDRKQSVFVNVRTALKEKISRENQRKSPTPQQAELVDTLNSKLKLGKDVNAAAQRTDYEQRSADTEKELDVDYVCKTGASYSCPRLLHTVSTHQNAQVSSHLTENINKVKRNTKSTLGILNKGANNLVTTSQRLLNNCHDDQNVSDFRGLFPQWSNKDALCWLDVVLCLIVHNKTVRKVVCGEDFDKGCLMYKLFKAHEQATELLHRQKNRPMSVKNVNKETTPQPQDASDKVESHSATSKRCQKRTLTLVGPRGYVDVKTGAGQIMGPNEKVSQEKLDEGSASLNNSDEIGTLLSNVREDIWKKLKQRLKCERGQNDSPVFAFPLLLQDNAKVERLFRMRYNFRFSCPKCEHEEDNEYDQTMPSFPSVVKDFNIGDPEHKRQCYRCGYSKGCRNMVYKKLPQCLLMHFVEGLPSMQWSELQFGYGSNLYTVTGVVQYINNPDHFIAWMRDPNVDRWMKCDDLKSQMCTYQNKPPQFPSKQIHIVMWEVLQVKAKLYKQLGGQVNKQVPGALAKNDKQTDVASATKLHSSRKQADFDISMNDIRGRNLVDTDSHSCQNTEITVNGSHLSSRTETDECIKNQLCSISKASSICNVTTMQETPISSTRNSMVDTLRFLTSSNTNGKCFSDSPCSSLSSLSGASTDSFNLPEFVTSTPVCRGIVKPVPHKTYSGTSLEALKLSSMQTSNVHAEGGLKYSYAEHLINKNIDASPKCVVNGSETDTTTVDNIGVGVVRSNKDISEQLDRNNLPTIYDSSRNQIVKQTIGSCIQGPVTEIKPSTVFCRPQKSKTCDKTLTYLTNQKSPISSVGKTYYKSPIINQVEQHRQTGTRQSVTSSSSSKFKMPHVYGSKAKAKISKDAFKTINQDSRNYSSPSLSTHSSPSVSPLMNGNLMYLSAIKQYLIKKATTKSETKVKFEGLNLKTAPNLQRTNMSGLDIFHSRTNSACSKSSEMGDNLSLKVSSRKEENSCTSTHSETVHGVKRKSPESYYSSQEIKKLKNTKIDKTDPEKIVAYQSSINCVEEQPVLSCSTQLNPRQRSNGGKSMRLIRKYGQRNTNLQNINPVNHCDKKVDELHAETDVEKQNLPDKNRISPDLYDKARKLVGSSCETDTVLQDLYEALNIPFNTVKDTMSDIMMDVDDILGIVDPVEMVTGQQRSASPITPLSCSTGHQTNNMDCWIAKMNRKSA